MARMIYDIKVIDDNPEKAKINRLCFDGSISEMVSMLLYPISKMMEQSVKEWGTTGADAFKALLLSSGWGGD